MKGRSMYFVNVFKAIFIFLFALTSVGCAFGTRQVLLTYPPDMKIDGNVVQAETEVKAPNGIRVALRAFRDERSNKTTIGEVRNGYAMKTSDAIAQNDVAEWVTNAIAYELKAEGFEVTTHETNSDTAMAVISGDIITVYCTALFSYEGEVSFYGAITQEGSELHRNRYTAQGTAGMNWAATSASYGKSLGDALQKAAKAFVIDVKQKVVDSDSKAVTTAHLEPLAVATPSVPVTANPPSPQVTAPVNSVQANAELSPPAHASIPDPSLGYGYLQWEYSETSKGNFPLELSLSKVDKKETLGRGERIVTKVDAGMYSVMILDPDLNTRSKPNWEDYEVQVTVERSGYTRVVFDTDPKGKNGVISVSVFSGDELLQQRFIAEK